MTKLKHHILRIEFPIYLFLLILVAAVASCVQLSKGTNKPLFANRDGISVYSLAEVDRERRSGYVWYTCEPDLVFKEYPLWQKKGCLIIIC